MSAEEFRSRKETCEELRQNVFGAGVDVNKKEGILPPWVN